jgi:hypothetical protein
MNLPVIKFKQNVDTYKDYTYSKFIRYGLKFNLHPFANINFTIEIMNIQNRYDHIYFSIRLKTHS